MHGLRLSGYLQKIRLQGQKKIGTPDLLILFTNTVSHKMMLSATHEAKRCHIPIARIHTSSANALNAVLAEQFGNI